MISQKDFISKKICVMSSWLFSTWLYCTLLKYFNNLKFSFPSTFFFCLNKRENDFVQLNIKIEYIIFQNASDFLRNYIASNLNHLQMAVVKSTGSVIYWRCDVGQSDFSEFQGYLFEICKIPISKDFHGD